MASLLETVKRLNKEFKDDQMIIKSNIIPKYDRLASGALGSDYVLFGGLPYGRLCVYSGLQHSGKTTGNCSPSISKRESRQSLCLCGCRAFTGS